ncbi:MAG: TonB-dependent receptor [Gammaproteobacteria bacterium]|nr:MAG: TonB-dependent receptor [Gammaproteobacteria bacterium]
MRISILFGTAALTVLSALDVASAQNDGPGLLEEVTVTGYRGALLNSTEAKRASVGFVDEIFADDLGKLPSQNLAESLNRIPGVRLNREVTGEGQQISVRGLGPGFTKIVLNGNAMAVASTGSLDAGNRNREVDLDVFPTELFASLAVNKTARARQLEGGVSGYVDMRTLRPSDLADKRFQYGVEAAYGALSEEVSPRYSFIAGHSGERFGALLALAGAQNRTRVDGYEAVALYTDGCVAQWTAPDRSASGCVPGSQGLNHFFWSPEVTPDWAASHPGSNVGDPIDPVATSGLPADVLDLARVPYLGRPMTTVGDRDRLSALVSLEYTPSEDLQAALDLIWIDASRDFVRTEAMWWGRRNYLHQGAAMIPEDVQVNAQGYVAFGRFYNAHLWVGTRDYREDLGFTAVMPSVRWQIDELWRLDVSASSTRSEFDRDEPYVLYMSPGGTLEYELTGAVPSFRFSFDPADPTIGWSWQQTFDQNQNGVIEDNERFGDMFRIQRNHRETETTGFHVDAAYGQDPERNGLLFGLAWDENVNQIRFFGGTAEFRDEHVIPSDAYQNFAAYLGPSLVSNLGADIDGYDGYRGIAQVDWGRIKAATRYDAFVPVEGAGDQFGQVNGTIEEQMLGLYLESNLTGEIGDRELRLDAGVRWVDTDQRVSSHQSGTTRADYSRLLPAFSAVYDLHEDIKLRASASRSLTRANPSEMYPNASWGSSGIDSVRAGNPYLSPFESTNFDIGGEWYYGELGYIGLTLFQKDITGFTRQDTITVPFLELPNYGMDIDNLGADREQALLECGGPENCTVQVTTRTNVQGTSTLTGSEWIWVMPLDVVTPGLGFNLSVTHIDQKASDPDAIITGISDWVYNLTAYYERGAFQSRITYFHQDGAVVGYTQGKPLIGMDRSQVDFSLAYRLFESDGHELSLTFDGYNITNEPVGAWHEYEGIPFSAYYPGATYTIGLRGGF